MGTALTAESFQFIADKLWEADRRPDGGKNYWKLCTIQDDVAPEQKLHLELESESR